MEEKYTFYQMPKFLFSQELCLSPSAKILYTLLLDREKISKTNSESYTDSEGKVFVLFSYETAAKMLGCGHTSISAYLKELISAGLISKKRVQKGPSRIYITEVLNSENTKSGIPKFDFSEFRNLNTNNNKYNNNKFNNNYKRSAKKSQEERPEPSYDLDAFTRKAYMNPMLYFEKQKKKEEEAEKNAIVENNCVSQSHGIDTPAAG